MISKFRFSHWQRSSSLDRQFLSRHGGNMDIVGLRFNVRRFGFVYLFFITLIFFGFQQVAFADEVQSCPTIDLRVNPQPWLTRYLSQTYNQLDLGYCFAYSAADLLSIKQKQAISPTHLAINHFATISPVGVSVARKLHLISQYLLQGGTSDVTFYLLKPGTLLCEQSAFPIKTFDRWTLLKLYSIFNQKPVSMNDYLILSSKWKSNYLSLSEFIAQLRMGPNNFFEQKLNELFLQSCGNEVVEIQPFHVRQFFPEDKNDQQSMRSVSIDIMKDLVQSQLSKGQAVQINYGVKVLDNSSGLHSSSVIGQKDINGECRYLIRNTWRTNYDSYRKDVIKEQGMSAIWVKAEDLFQSVQTMNVID